MRSAAPSRAGLKQSHPDADVTEMPLSDGGEGVLDMLRRALALQLDRQAGGRSPGPAGDRPLWPFRRRHHRAGGDGRGASGLQRLTLDERDPLLTSTFGTGQLLADARARGARRALLAIGGSATNDAGIGAAAALGWRFLDASGKDVPPDGGHMKDIARMLHRAPAPFDKDGGAVRRHQSALWPHGRGLDLWPPERRRRCQCWPNWMTACATSPTLVKEQLGRDVADMPGAGAAGGLGLWRRGLPERQPQARHRNGAGPGRL